MTVGVDDFHWQNIGSAMWACNVCGGLVGDRVTHIDWHNSQDDGGWLVASDGEPEVESPDAVPVSGALNPDGLLVKGIRWEPTKDKINEWAQTVWDTTLVNGAELSADQALHIAKCIWPDIIDWANANYQGENT